MINKKVLLDELIGCIKDSTDTDTKITRLELCATLMRETLNKFDKISYDNSNAEIWVKPNKPLNELPEGTKAKALGGGHWVKNKRGWKWCTGATFPNVGGDWDGTVLFPKILNI